MRRWTDEKDLGYLLIGRAQKGKSCLLSPDTAYFVGLKLLTAGEKPTRDEVAMLLCSSRCERPCYACTCRANEIVRAYGARADVR